MHLDIQARFAYDLAQPAPLLVQVELAEEEGQRLISRKLELSHDRNFARIPGHGGFGSRLWVDAADRFSLVYRAEVQVTRQAAEIEGLAAVPLHRLPDDVVEYLMPSRYCPSDAFEAAVASDFAGLEGGACVARIRDWVADHFTYGSFGVAGATALECYARREGVCRDYAHVVISLVRAAHIPARYASVYAPRVDPPDFHAVAEVYLAGAWHLIDATGMSTPEETAIVGIGRDAADVAFLSIFGRADFAEQSVSVSVI